MKINHLTLAQFRAFEQAEINFQPRINLIVGVNGVGKSTVLDALRIMFSQILPKLTASRSKSIEFDLDDITINRGSLTAEIDFTVAEIDFNYLVHKPRESYRPDETREGEVREQTYSLIKPEALTPDKIPPELKEAENQPLVVYFSTRRSFVETTSKKIPTGKASAYVDSLTPRGLRLEEFAQWMLAQETLAKEGLAIAEKHLKVLKDAICQFLDNCSNLQVISEPKTTLLLDKNGKTLDVRLFSDGERGILSLVLDLAKRLSQANPNLDNPLTEGQAIVLIDELDLHLHPRWQRTIVERLTNTFRGCQFIATTHSPQIIGEVDPENIIILEMGESPFRPDQSLGMDTNWILRYLMGASERDENTEEELQNIADLIESEEYDEATDRIDIIREKLGEFPELVRLQTRIDRLQLLEE